MIPTSDFHETEYVGEHFKARSFMSGFYRFGRNTDRMQGTVLPYGQMEDISFRRQIS